MHHKGLKVPLCCKVQVITTLLISILPNGQQFKILYQEKVSIPLYPFQRCFFFCLFAFTYRNLRRCKKMVGKPIKSKANPVHQQRNQAKLLHSGKHQRQKKRKSLEKDDTSGHLSPVDLTLEDELPANEGLQRLKKVPKKQSVSDVSGFMDMQADGSGLEGTRRVLKFNIPPAAALAETHTPKHHPVHRCARTKLHEGQADFTAENRDCPRKLDDVLCVDSDVFRSPMDHFSADLKITRKSRSSRPFDTRKDSFRTMLAALGQGHNQIIKESHP